MTRPIFHTGVESFHSLARPATAVAIGLLLAARNVLAGPVVAEDFEQASAGVMTFPASVTPPAQLIADNGSIDAYMGKPGRCVTFKAVPSGKEAGVAIDVAAQKSGVTDLARLTLGVDVWISGSRPTGLSIASLDAAGKPNGTLAGTIISPVINAWYRHGIDLSTLKAAGGKFDPQAAKFRISFTPATGSDASPTELRVDNLSLSAPSFYVSESGNDKADGKTEATAFATIQRAIDLATPGDVAMVLSGTYKNKGNSGIATINKAGSPAKWITLRGAPGPQPKLVNTGWEIFKLNPGAAYIEIRGFEMIGNAKNVKLEDALADGKIKEKDGKKYGGDPIFNGNAVSAEGRSSTDLSTRPHHLRYIGNYVHDNCGAGLCANFSDYITTEGNTVEHNVHYMRYGGSGMSYLALSNWTSDTSYRNFMLNNVLRDNGCFVPWAAVQKMSDGNGIIIDVNIQKDGSGKYSGRTLIANNLVIGSGGGGITVTTSSHVDIVHNTLYHNVQTPELAKAHWGDILISGPPPNCEDVRVYNNILWAAPGREILHAGRAQDFTLKNNIYFGDKGAKFSKGDAGDANNLVANPMLKNASMNGTPDDFRPTAGSPALGHGAADLIAAPPTDLSGTARPAEGKVTAGAFQETAR